MNLSVTVPKSAAARARRAKTLMRALPYGVLVLVVLALMMPVVWLVITSVKRDIEYLSYPIVFLPAVPQWSNFVEVFKPVYGYLRHAGMTLFLAVTFSTLCVLSSSLCGYAFARYRDVKANSRLFTIVIALIIIPVIVYTIPAYMIFAKMHLTGTYWPWVLWGLAGSPGHIFIFRQFFLSFPKELEDAAEVDGCTPFGIFWRVFLPNAKAAMATSFILNFMWVWGDWLTPAIYLKADNTTLAVIINTVFRNPAGQFMTTVTIASIVIYTLPIVVVFFFSQKYILKGVVTSGLSGR